MKYFTKSLYGGKLHLHSAAAAGLRWAWAHAIKTSPTMSEDAPVVTEQKLPKDLAAEKGMVNVQIDG